MGRALPLAMRILAREWRSGDLAVLFLALFVAVAALTGVGFLVDRIDRAMTLQASEVLGADVRLQSPDPIGAIHDEEARRRGWRIARSATTLSVVLRGDATQLANVHAVSEGYPLRGKVRVSDQAFGEPSQTSEVPGPGEVWPDSRLLAALQARVGDLLTVGEIQLRATRVMISRPDQGSGFVDLSPSLLMNLADLPATKLVLPGSRVRYAVLFAGERNQIVPIATWVAGNRTPAERQRNIAEASPEVNNASTRAARFLGLASLASVLLCAIAVAMTARRYVKRHLDLVALMKTLGASRAEVLAISVVQLTCIALAASVLGAAAGWLAQGWLVSVIKDMLEAELPPSSWAPAFTGLLASLLLLMGFALPPIIQLARVPAIRILRRDIGPPPLTAVLAFGPAVLAIAVLIWRVNGAPRQSMIFLGALLVLAAVLALAGYAMVQATRMLRGSVGIAWRFGAANLARRRAESLLQVVALGIGLTVLLLLAVIRGDLINDWRKSLPQDAPNYFFVNIAPEDRDSLQQFIEGEGGTLARMLPMIRGRMTQINGEPAGSRAFGSGRGEEFAQREQNLTWAAEIGPDNTITEGKWFTAEDHGKPLVSVATDFQESMQLKLGDRLRFDIAGETIDVTISSFRRVEWDSMQPNFFLMFPPGLLEGAAGTWMGAARFRPSDPSTIANLVRRFPGVSIFDLDDLLGQVRSIIDKAVLAVQGVFLFTLLAGTIVLLAAVQATRDERRYESAMLRTLGAPRRTVLAGVLVEFALIGLLAGLLAAAAASLGGFLLATRFLEVPYTPNPMLWFSGAAVGVALVCGAGWLATRSALVQPPMETLRHG